MGMTVIGNGGGLRTNFRPLHGLYVFLILLNLLVNQDLFPNSRGGKGHLLSQEGNEGTWGRIGQFVSWRHETNLLGTLLISASNKILPWNVWIDFRVPWTIQFAQLVLYKTINTISIIGFQNSFPILPPAPSLHSPFLGYCNGFQIRDVFGGFVLVASHNLTG